MVAGRTVAQAWGRFSAGNVRKVEARNLSGAGALEAVLGYPFAVRLRRAMLLCCVCREPETESLYVIIRVTPPTMQGRRWNVVLLDGQALEIGTVPYVRRLRCGLAEIASSCASAAALTISSNSLVYSHRLGWKKPCFQILLSDLNPVLLVP